MEFSTSILPDFFGSIGCKVVARPRRHATFERAAAALPVEGERRVLAVVDRPEDLPANGFGIVATAGGPLPDEDRPAFGNLPNAFVVALPEGSSWRAAHLADRIQAYLMEVLQWVNDMDAAIMAGEPCIELLRLSEPILKNNVVLTDSTFTYIAHTPDIPAIEESSRYLIAHGHYPADVVKRASTTWMGKQWLTQTKSVIHETNPICDKPSINHVYRLDSQYGAHMVMICPEPVAEGQAFLFELLVKAVGHWLKLAWDKRSPFERRYTAFLEALLAGRATDPEYRMQQAECVGIPLEATFKVCLMKSSWPGGSTNYFAEHTVNAVPGSWVVLDGNDLVVVLCESTGAAGELLRMEESLFDLAESLDAEVGVSRKFYDLANADLALKEARIALRYGSAHARLFTGMNALVSKDKGDRVFRFKRFFPYFAADYANPKVGDFIADFYRRGDPLSDIAREDGRHGTNDLAVLRAYLLCEGRIAQVCDTMQMARNTVKYRLKRLERIYHLDLSDPDERMFLRALYLLPLPGR